MRQERLAARLLGAAAAATLVAGCAAGAPVGHRASATSHVPPTSATSSALAAPATIAPAVAPPSTGAPAGGQPPATSSSYGSFPPCSAAQLSADSPLGRLQLANGTGRDTYLLAPAPGDFNATCYSLSVPDPSRFQPLSPCGAGSTTYSGPPLLLSTGHPAYLGLSSGRTCFVVGE